MSYRTAAHFRIPRSRKDQYCAWRATDFEGWVDTGVLDALDAVVRAAPEKLLSLPDSRIVRDVRNLTVTATLAGRHMWIKRFQPRSAVDRLVYGSGSGKAAYAWNAAMALAERGFCTPRPLIGLRGTGRLGGAEGIVAFEDIEKGTPLGDLLADDIAPVADRADLLRSLGRCLKRFHDTGFRHRDLRRGNILAVPGDDGWSFCFLDLNRLRVQAPLSYVQRLREVERLNLPANGLTAFFDAYMPDRNSVSAAASYGERIAYADKLESRPLGRLLRKTWYYSWEVRAFSRTRRP